MNLLHEPNFLEAKFSLLINKTTLNPQLLKYLKSDQANTIYIPADNAWKTLDTPTRIKATQLLDTKPKKTFKTKTYNINIVRNRLHVVFDYDPKMVAELTATQMFRWNAKSKYWSAPLIAAPSIAHLKLSWSPEALQHKTLNNRMMLLSKDDGSTSTFEVEGLKRSLKNYQRSGVEYLTLAKDSFLSDAIGLGKTFISIATVEYSKEYPCLVVCEKSLKSNWRREINMSVDRSVLVVEGRQPVDMTGYEYIIINNDLLAYQQSALCDHKFRSLIVDESSNFANASKRTAALKRISSSVAGKGPRLLLSATPITNGKHSELMNQLEIIDRHTEFGSKTFIETLSPLVLHDFLRSRCYLRRTSDIVYSNVDTSMRFDDMFLDVDLTEYHKAKRDVVKYVGDLAAQAAKDMGTSVSDARVKAIIKASAGEVLIRFGLLRRLVGAAKCDPCIDWVKRFLVDNPGEKIIVFAYFRETVERLAAGLGCNFIAGGVSTEDRGRFVDDFQSDPDCRVIVLNTRAAGKGLTLSAASTVLFVEQEVSAAWMRQCLGRAHFRADNPHAARGVVAVAAGSIDERLRELVLGKLDVSDGVVDGGVSVGEFGDGFSQGVLLDGLRDYLGV
jgi:SWI/SNF-related matrix-associated actin-dependent regulator of chromatin subfamily A-like protein 1